MGRGEKWGRAVSLEKGYIREMVKRGEVKEEVRARARLRVG